MRTSLFKRLSVIAVAVTVLAALGAALPARADRPSIGNNIDGFANFYTDMIKQADGSWSTVQNPQDDAAPSDADGWPIGDVGLFVNRATSSRQGTYHMVFTGRAQVQAYLFGCTWAAGGQTYTNGILPFGAGYNSATNTTTADLILSGGQSINSLVFTQTRRNPGDTTATGFTGLHLWRPVSEGSSTSYTAATTFLPEALAEYAMYDHYRFMNVTNWCLIRNWEDRTRPDRPSDTRILPAGFDWYGYTVQGGPVTNPTSLEYMIRWANTQNKDLYICIPAMADDDYITKTAQVLRYGSDGHFPYTSPQANPVYAPLNPNLHVYIEYSNETWNNTFEQFSEVWAAASGQGYNSDLNYRHSWNGVDTYSYALADAYVTQRTVTISKRYRAVFGDSAMTGTSSNPRVRPLLMWQYQDKNNTASNRLGYLNNFYNNGDGIHVPDPHPPIYYVWGAGGATYYNGNLPEGDMPGQTDYITTTVDQILQAGVPNDGWYSVTQTEVRLAKYYGLHSAGYEGGLAVGGDGMKNAAVALRSDPRIKPIDETLTAAFASYGGELLTYGTYYQALPLQQAAQDLTSGNYVFPAVNYGAPVPGDVPGGVDYFRGEDLQNSYGGETADYLLLASSGGSYTLQLNTASGRDASDPNYVRVYVNGVLVTPQGGATIPPTGGFGTQFAALSPGIPITLNAGQNGIHLYAVHGDMNLYNIRVTAGSGGTTPTAATPTFSPAGGSFTSAQSVTISDSTSGAAIHYTTDGSTPTAASPTYSGAINVSATTTINAIATASGYAASTVATATYTISTGSLIDRTNETGGLIQARGDNAPNEAKAFAFDNNLNTKWLDFSNSSWISYQFANNASYVITEYKITSGNDTATYPGRAPNSWVLKGSNDGTTFVTLDTRTNVADTANLDTQVYDFANSTAYKIYKLDSIATNGDSILQVSEIRLLGPAGGGGTVAGASINAGGGAVGTFGADAGFSGSSNTATVTNTIDTSGVTNPAPQAVYQSERYGSMTYTLGGLTAGAAYTLRLHFAELYWTAAGSRVFNVSVNGTAALTNFDIFAKVGARYKADVEQVSTTANSSGQIVVAFTSVTDNAEVTGLEAVAGGGGGTTTGSLVGSGTTFTTATTANLTATGPTDWAHWGLNGTTKDHKSTGGGAISDYSVVGGGGANAYSDNLVGFTWTDGTPTSRATNTTTGVWIGGTGNGFSFTVPADTNAKTLTVYVGGYNSDGQLTAHLSDGSAADFTDNSYGFDKAGNIDGAHYCAAYTLTYNAASAGKTLTVTWVQTGGSGNVTLQAVADPPASTRPATPTGVTATAGAAGSKAITVQWTAVSGAISYTVYRSTTGTGVFAQAGRTTGTSVTNTGLTAGTTYYYKVVAMNSSGLSARSGVASAVAR